MKRAFLVFTFILLLIPSFTQAQTTNYFETLEYNTENALLQIINEVWGTAASKSCPVNLTQDIHYLIHIETQGGLGWRTQLEFYAFGDPYLLEFMSNKNDTWAVFIPLNTTSYTLRFSRSAADDFMFNITLSDIWPIDTPSVVTEIVTQWNTTTVTHTEFVDRYFPILGDPSIWLPLTGVIFSAGMIVTYYMWKRNNLEGK